MPHTRMSLAEAANYLHLKESEVLSLYRHGELPSTGGASPLFVKQELHDWAAQRLLGGDADSVAAFHTKAGAQLEPVPAPDQPFISSMLQEPCIELNCKARSKGRVLRQLVRLAGESCLISDDEHYLELLEEREALCSTALGHGVALPHSRVHRDYLVFESFLVVLVLESPIHFGAEDNQPTDLFIMPCAHDDRIHLYMIARLARMLHDTALADELRACQKAADVITAFAQHERALIHP